MVGRVEHLGSEASTVWPRFVVVVSGTGLAAAIGQFGRAVGWW